MKKIILTLTLIAVSLSAFAGGSKKSEEVEPFDRGIGLPSQCFIPSGTVSLTMAANYSTYGLGIGAADPSFKMLFNLLDLKGDFYTLGFSPAIQYFVKDNISVGLRFDYDRTKLGLGKAGLALGDDLSFGVEGLNYLKQSYTGAITVRDYIPIANSKRFAIFAELAAGGSYAQTESYKSAEQADQSVNNNGTYQDIYKASIGVVPGIVCFMSNEAALEVSVGVLGFDYQRTVQKSNGGEQKSIMQSSNANFKINLLSIKIGMSFYILTGKHRAKKA